MNELTANKTQVMCPGCGLGHICFSNELNFISEKLIIRGQIQRIIIFRVGGHEPSRIKALNSRAFVREKAFDRTPIFSQ